MNQKLVMLSLLLTYLLIPSAIYGQPSTTQMVEKLASGANALLIVDLDQIRNSAIAEKERWFDTPLGKIESGMAFLPADTNKVALAAQMDFGQLAPNWTSGLMTMQAAPTLTAISRKLNGRIDAVAGHDVVLSSSDMFIFGVNPTTLATYSPANRQMFASWLTSVKQSQSSMMNARLNGAVIAAKAGVSMVLAFDLANVVSPGAVLQRAKDAALLKQHGIDAKGFSELIGSIQGVQIDINVGQAIYTNIEIDFATSPQSLAPVANQLLVEFVQQHGVNIANAKDWKSKVSGNKVTFDGQITKSDLRRLLSLFDMPEHHMTAAAPDTDPEQPSDPGTATKNYYDAVSSLLEELRNDIGVGGQSTYQIQRWVKSYADKIDNLPIKNVDPDMLNFGNGVSQTFRNISLQVTTTHKSTQVQNTELMAYGSGSPKYRYRNTRWGYYGYGYGYGYGGWRYGGWVGPKSGARAADVSQTEAEKRDIRQKARAGVADSASQAFVEIKAQEQAVRDEMSQKYPENF